MKTTSILTLRVEADFRTGVQEVLAKGETHSQSVDALKRPSLERRRVQTDLIAGASLT
jgi:hypothetical protein